MNNVAWCHKFLFKKINLFLVFLKFLTMNKLILLSLLYRTKGITSPFPLWPVKLIRNHFGEFFRKISMIKNFIPITRLGKAEILWGFSRKETMKCMFPNWTWSLSVFHHWWQWFPTGDNFAPLSSPPTRGQLAMSGEIFGWHTFGGGGLLASSE